MVGSFESELIFFISGSGDATDEMVTNSLVGAPDISVEHSRSKALFQGRFCSPEDCSTWKMSDFVELEEFLWIILKEMKLVRQLLRSISWLQQMAEVVRWSGNELYQAESLWCFLGKGFHWCSQVLNDVDWSWYFVNILKTKILKMMNTWVLFLKVSLKIYADVIARSQSK